MRKILLGLAFAVFAAGVHAQQIKVSVGSETKNKENKFTSTYSRMFMELTEKCSTKVALVPFYSSGSVENIDRLVNNETNAAIVQWDAFWLRSQKEDLGGIKTLFVLAPEEVHVVARSDAKFGDHMGFGGDPMTEVRQLKGKKVGAAGGSVETAKALQFVGELPIEIKSFGDNSAVLKALAEKQIDAAILVAGAPSTAVGDLGSNYRVLAFTDSLRGKLSKLYKTDGVSVSYSKLFDSQSIPTISTEAVLLTRDYKTAKYATELLNLRKCLVDNLDELKEDAGMHPKWSAVKLENKGRWAWYDPQIPGMNTQKKLK